LVDTHLVFPGLAPLYTALATIAYPLRRVAVGAFLLPHGAQKLFGWFGADPAGERGLFEEVGLKPPGPWIVFIGVIQFMGGILLVLGLLTRPAALVVAISMLGTAWFVTHRDGWFWNRRGMEYSLFWAIAAFVVFCNGGGAFSLDALLGREF
jgi:putative oxidoreductase